ncbi:MAG: flavin reductase family protein [Gammaproteobacteria bacterium]|nr:flavin reductase family protein [Gammaproteobacteria bacterium]
MIIDLADLSPNQVYYSLIQTLIPRPVAWVLSENSGGNFNLAPFSYFSGVCSDPPLIMISVGQKPDGTNKDTRVNILARRHFVIHIANRNLATAVTNSSASLAYGDSELERLGLTTEPFPGSPLPRLAACPIAFACQLYDYRELGRHQQQAMILGEVKQLYLNDDVAQQDEKGRLTVDATAVDPIARLGGNDYTRFGEVITVPRPK